jgi:hypothetical protein
LRRVLLLLVGVVSGNVLLHSGLLWLNILYDHFFIIVSGRHSCFIDNESSLGEIGMLASTGEGLDLNQDGVLASW